MTTIPTKMNSFSPLCSGSDSEYEAHSDYYGFPSNPVSIYHTGDPWSRPKGPDAQRVPKEARPVTNPKLALVWNKLGRRIYEYLDEAKAKWSSIDLVRFAEVGKKSGPIFIWVGIVPKSLTREGAEELAIGCKEILTEFHFADIEIAFRESVYNQLAGQKLLNYVDSLDPTAGVRGPFTPAVGLRISPMSYPFYSGTGGVYFCEGGDSERILFITARHVVFPPPHESNEVYVYNNNSAPRLNVMLSNKSYGDTLESIQTQIDSQEQMVDLYQRRIKHFASTGVNTLMKYSYLLEESQQSIVVLKEFLGEIDGNWGTASKRILGHVIYSPPTSVGIGPQLLTEDWAIVELYQAKLDSETFKGNVIDLGTTIHPHDFTRKMYPDDTTPTSFKYPDDRLLQLRDFLREDELTPTATGQDDEPCIMVLKNGHATGVTIGRATGIKSFVRKYDDFPGYDIPSTSMEIAIHSYGNETHFSSNGDSGSIVADGQGRLVGLVTGGAGMINSIDVTYATPYYWLDERIKSVFPEAYLYPAMP